MYGKGCKELPLLLTTKSENKYSLDIGDLYWVERLSPLVHTGTQIHGRHDRQLTGKNL